MNDPEDLELERAFGRFEPTPAAVARIEARWLERLGHAAPESFTLSSLAREWQTLLSERPAANSLLLAAAAIVLLLASPLALAPLAWLV